MEIDNEMGKTLLEYMSGNYELVMPPMIQEVLMTPMCEVPPIANIMRAWELDKLNNLWFGALQHDAKEWTNMEFFEEVPEDYDCYGMPDVAANIKNFMEKNQLLMGWVLIRKTSRVCEAVAASIMDIVYCDTTNTLVDMLTQVFLPASSAGECQRDFPSDVDTVTMNHSHIGNTTSKQGNAARTILNVDILGMELITSVEAPSFVECLLHQCTSLSSKDWYGGFITPYTSLTLSLIHI